MIAAVSIIKNEADIVGFTVGHLFAEGVDRIYVIDESSDGTREILAGLGVVLVGWDRPYAQAQMMTYLANLAASDGAEWIIPFDADELWCALDGTLATMLAGCPVDKVWVPIYDQLGDYRAATPKPLPKVTFRWHPGSQLAEGNHDVFGIPGVAAEGGIEIREYQNRSLAQFIRKAHRNRDLFAANPQLPPSYGAHNRRWAAMTDQEVTEEWERIQQEPRVFSPPRSSSRLGTAAT